jgi:mono/diheme cytochrome c family protein
VRSPVLRSPASGNLACIGEAVLAVIVFASTAVLGEITRGRHVERVGKASSHVTNKGVVRRTSEGVAGGTMTPPPGDEATGRTVFVKLRCFDCHTVQGGSCPAPSRPGPDLSAVGRDRHPGDLVESIVNPNAMVLDGPGFLDATGASTMPDYRERLSVSELIDLVAYLRTLDRERAGP